MLFSFDEGLGLGLGLGFGVLSPFAAANVGATEVMHCRILSLMPQCTANSNGLVPGADDGNRIRRHGPNCSCSERRARNGQERACVRQGYSAGGEGAPRNYQCSAQNTWLDSILDDVDCLRLVYLFVDVFDPTSKMTYFQLLSRSNILSINRTLSHRWL